MLTTLLKALTNNSIKGRFHLKSKIYKSKLYNSFIINFATGVRFWGGMTLLISNDKNNRLHAPCHSHPSVYMSGRRNSDLNRSLMAIPPSLNTGLSSSAKYSQMKGISMAISSACSNISENLQVKTHIIHPYHHGPNVSQKNVYVYSPFVEL